MQGQGVAIVCYGGVLRRCVVAEVCCGCSSSILRSQESLLLYLQGQTRSWLDEPLGTATDLAQTTLVVHSRQVPRQIDSATKLVLGLAASAQMHEDQHDFAGITSPWI